MLWVIYTLVFFLFKNFTWNWMKGGKFWSMEAYLSLWFFFFNFENFGKILFRFCVSISFFVFFLFLVDSSVLLILDSASMFEFITCACWSIKKKTRCYPLQLFCFEIFFCLRDKKKFVVRVWAADFKRWFFFCCCEVSTSFALFDWIQSEKKNANIHSFPLLLGNSLQVLLVLMLCLIYRR